MARDEARSKAAVSARQQGPTSAPCRAVVGESEAGGRMGPIFRKRVKAGSQPSLPYAFLNITGPFTCRQTSQTTAQNGNTNQDPQSDGRPNVRISDNAANTQSD